MGIFDGLLSRFSGDTDGVDTGGDATGTYLGNTVDPSGKTTPLFRQARAQEGLMGLAQGLIAGGAPSRMPTGFMSAFGQGLSGMAASQHALIDDTLKSAQANNQMSDAEYKRIQGADIKDKIQWMQTRIKESDAEIDRIKGGAPAAPAATSGSSTPPVSMSPGEAINKTGLASRTADESINPYVRALMDTAAGPESGGLYNIRYGGPGSKGELFNDYSQHPQIYEPTADGRKSSAAGRLQWVYSTWAPNAAAVGVKDFSPVSQDKVSDYVMRSEYLRKTGRDLVADLQAGKQAEVASALRGTWATLPKAIGSYNSNLQKYLNPPSATAADQRQAVGSVPPSLMERAAAGAPPPGAPPGANGIDPNRMTPSQALQPGYAPQGPQAASPGYRGPQAAMPSGAGAPPAMAGAPQLPNAASMYAQPPSSDARTQLAMAYGDALQKGFKGTIQDFVAAATQAGRSGSTMPQLTMNPGAGEDRYSPPQTMAPQNAPPMAQPPMPPQNAPPMMPPQSGGEQIMAQAAPGQPRFMGAPPITAPTGQGVPTELDVAIAKRNILIDQRLGHTPNPRDVGIVTFGTNAALRAAEQGSAAAAAGVETHNRTVAGGETVQMNFPSLGLTGLHVPRATIAQGPEATLDFARSVVGKQPSPTAGQPLPSSAASAKPSTAGQPLPPSPGAVPAPGAAAPTAPGEAPATPAAYVRPKVEIPAPPSTAALPAMGDPYLSPEAKDRVGSLNKHLEASEAEAKSAGESLHSLNVLERGLDGVKTGSNAETVQQYKKFMVSWLGKTAPEDWVQSVANGELVLKEGTLLGLKLARQGDSNPAQLMVQAAIDANPGLKTTEVGGKLLVKLLQQAQQRIIDRAEFYQNYRFNEKNPGRTMEGAQEAFEKLHPNDAYISRVMPFVPKNDAAIKALPPGTVYKSLDGKTMRVVPGGIN